MHVTFSLSAVIRDDVFCPEASEWDCDEFFECKERVWDDVEASREAKTE